MKCSQQRIRWKEGQPWGPPPPWTPSEFWTCACCGETKPNTTDYWMQVGGTTKGAGRKSADGKDELRSPCRVCMARRQLEREKEYVPVPCPCGCGCGNDKNWRLPDCRHCHEMKKKYGECREGYNLSPDDLIWLYLKVSKTKNVMKVGVGSAERVGSGAKTYGFEVRYKVRLTRKETLEWEKKVLDLWGGKHPKRMEHIDGFTEMRELDYELLDAAIDMVEGGHTDRIYDIIEP